MQPVRRVELARGYSIPRLVVGCWQLSEGHGPATDDRAEILDAWSAMADAGLTAFDCADIYTGVEELLGEFLARRRAAQGQRADPGAGRRLQLHTKLVPDRDALPRVDRRYVEELVDRSLRRLGVERLDLVQFAWWDYDVPGYVEAAGWLAEMQRAGKVRHVGATNFDVPHLREIVEAGVPIVSHQVQYSLLDARPAGAMADFCRQHDVHLLCYGTLAGGFLSERWLGRPAPREPLPNRSLPKYALIIEEFCGWELFQELLRLLARIASERRVGIGTVALRWVLDRPRVAGAIVGARSAEHLDSNLEVFGCTLEDGERARIDELLAASTGPQGRVYELERAPDSRHAAIMRYNLNREAGP